MKTSVRIALIACFAFIASSALFAQDWTKAQKEVWQVVTDSWAKTQTGDLDGMFATIHEKYQGWNNESPLPISKETVMKWYKSMKETSKVDDYELNPARIVVTDNAAVVDYYFWLKETSTVGEKKEVKEYYGKNAEFYVKEGGKWLLLGDLTIYKEKGAGGEEK
jgi:hypothetical protein